MSTTNCNLLVTFFDRTGFCPSSTTNLSMNGISDESKKPAYMREHHTDQIISIPPLNFRILEMHPFLKHINILKQKGEDTADMDREVFYIPVVGVRANCLI